jgi:hypothetical protein
MRSPHHPNHQTAIAYPQKVKVRGSPNHSFHKDVIAYLTKIMLSANHLAIMKLN